MEVHTMLFLKALIKNKKGVSTVVITLMLTVLIVFTALTADIGLIVVDKAKLSATIDAAALAGAQELIADSSNVNTVVSSYVQSNIGALKSVIVNVNGGEHFVEVTGVKTVQSFFSKIMGDSVNEIKALARARVENIKSLKGARPLAVVKQDFVFGQIYTLKEGAGDATSGKVDMIIAEGSDPDVITEIMKGSEVGTLFKRQM